MSDAAIRETWAELEKLKAQLDKHWDELHDNPLVMEVELLRMLYRLADGAARIPPELWDELWADLRAFGSCNAAPLVSRVKSNAEYASAVLRVLHGLSSILQGYIHDRIDAETKDLIERRSGWSKMAAKQVVKAIKKQVPVVPREVDTAKLEIWAAELAELKNEVRAEGADPKVVWAAAVEIAEALFENAKEEALKNGARWVAKKLAKRLVGSAAGGAALLFAAEDFLYAAAALEVAGAYEKTKTAYNLLLCKFVELYRSRRAFKPGENRDTVVWNPAHPALSGGRIDVAVVIRGFAPSGRTEGAGDWKEERLEVGLPGAGRRELRDGISVAIPQGGGTGEQPFVFHLPIRLKWPGKSSHYVAAALTLFDASGKRLDGVTHFMGACA